MSTPAQLAQYCADHFSQHKGFTMTTLEWVGAGLVVAYIVGRMGLTQLWTDMQSVYSTVKGWFTKSTPTATAPVTA